jgi:hypothetical protein
MTHCHNSADVTIDHTCDSSLCSVMVGTSIRTLPLRTSNLHQAVFVCSYFESLPIQHQENGQKMIKTL